MSDTPRTEAEVNRQKCWSDDLVTIDANFACQLELELNEANDRIKRLEEAGNTLVWYFCPRETGDLSYLQSVALKQWNAAKEAKP